MATDEKFAKPDSANVAIIKLLSDIALFIDIKSVNAIASLRTNLVPNSEPTFVI